jgi:hypothetical protein
MKFFYPMTLTGMLLAVSSLHAAEPAQPPTSAPISAPAMKDLVILFDTTMESTTLAQRAGGEAKVVALKSSFDQLSAQIKAWGARHGVSVDTFQFNGKEKIELGGRTYQFMLLEKITMEGLEEGGSGPKISGRQWEATGFVMNSPKDKPMPKLGHEIYSSDDVDCFAASTAAKGPAACPNRWLKTLSGHLQWFNAAWPGLIN